MPCKSAKQAGFTLMEVLIALVILALVGVMLAQSSWQSTDQSDYLKRKLVATWVAENRLVQLQLAAQQGQPLLLDEQRLEMGVWRWLTRVTPTRQASGVVRLQVDVYQAPNTTSSLYQLIGFVPITSQLSDNVGQE